jgi:carbonic anhydrase/acetyltransferase-like protein (isoleucine patch superfamily)
MTHREGHLFSFEGHAPRVDPSAWVAPGAHLIGQVTLAAQASVWFNAVLRADRAPILVGEGSNIQDNTTVHIERPEEREDGRAVGCVIGRNVTVGHNCVIHSCTLEDDVLVGMGSVILGGAVIGRGSIVGAGTVVLSDARIPPYSLVAGNPGTVRKTYDPAAAAKISGVAARVYRERIKQFRTSLSALRP